MTQYFCAFGIDWTDGDSSFSPELFACEKKDNSEKMIKKWLDSTFEGEWTSIKEWEEEYQETLVGFWIVDQKVKDIIDTICESFGECGSDSLVYKCNHTVKYTIAEHAKRIVWNVPKEWLLTCDREEIRLLAKEMP